MNTVNSQAFDSGAKKPGIRILIVEDDPEEAETLGRLFRMHGYEVQIAADGVKALEAFERGRPDVILLDIGLPGMDGYELATRIREQKAHKRPLLIAVTGYAAQQDRLRSYQVGIDLHLIKPVSFDEVCIFLDRYKAVTSPGKP